MATAPTVEHQVVVDANHAGQVIPQATKDLTRVGDNGDGTMDQQAFSLAGSGRGFLTHTQRLILPSDKDILSTSPTAWMNGLRGLTAFVVFNFHWLMPMYDGTHHGYGAAGLHSFISLPIIRLLYDGLTSVCIFFVVGGYVCSLRSLQLTATDQAGKAAQSLSASVFRRWFRLYLPVYAIMIISATMAYCGAYNYQWSLRQADKNLFIRNFKQVPLPQKPLKVQLYFLYIELIQISNPFFTNFFWPLHAPQTWTIVLEFRASMMLYVSLLGLGRCTPVARLVALLFGAVFSLYYDKLEVWLYFCGAAIAQYNVMQQTGTRDPQVTLEAKELDTKATFLQSQSIQGLYRFVLRPILYLLALFIMSVPDMDPGQPTGYYTWIFTYLAVKGYGRRDLIAKGYGSILFVFLLATSSRDATTTAPTLFHRLFLSPIAQHLGRIMYGLYLVHLAVFFSIGYTITISIWKLLGRGDMLSELSGVIIGWALTLVITLYIAKMFHRHVETRCVRLTSVIEKFCFGNGASG